MPLAYLKSTIPSVSTLSLIDNYDPLFHPYSNNIPYPSTYSAYYIPIMTYTPDTPKLFNPQSPQSD